MANRVLYEWTVEIREEASEEADIIDSRFYDTYAEALDDARSIGGDRHWQIGLVRDVGNDADGLVDRAWAYVRDGALPATFTYGASEDSGIKVPKRFHREVSA